MFRIFGSQFGFSFPDIEKRQLFEFCENWPEFGLGFGFDFLISSFGSSIVLKKTVMAIVYNVFLSQIVQ